MFNTKSTNFNTYQDQYSSPSRSRQNPTQLQNDQNLLTNLGIKYNPTNVQDLKQLNHILNQILEIPSIKLAKRHRVANSLGKFDQILINSSSSDWTTQVTSYEQPKINKEADYNKKLASDYCKCCHQILQVQKLSICVPLQKIKNIGVSTFLYFFTMKSISFLLFTTLLIFGLFKIISHNSSQISVNTSSTSDQYKFNSNHFYGAAWAGFAFVIVSMLMMIVIKYLERKYESLIDDQNTTAGDFTLLFRNYPKGLKKQKLQKQMQDYQDSIRSIVSSHLMQRFIQIAKVNETYPSQLYLQIQQNQQLSKIKQQCNNDRQSILKMIKEREGSQQFKTAKNQRFRKVESYLMNKKKKQELKKQLLLKNYQIFDQMETKPAFVTFKSIQNKELIQKLHRRSTYSWYNKLPCVNDKLHFHYHIQSNESHNSDLRLMAEITSAPQPQDIYWKNVQQNSSRKLKKLLLLISATLGIIVSSFFTNYFIQINLIKTNSKSGIIIASFIAALICYFAALIYRLGFKFYSSFSKTQQQVDIGQMGSIVVLVNSILILWVVSLTTQFKGLQPDNFVEYVFYFSVFNAIFSPFFSVFNLLYLINYFKIRHYSKIENLIKMDQKQLNSVYQKPSLKLGYQYIYPINMYLYSCFLVTVSPIVVIPALIGVILMFWIKKFVLYHHFSRPIPGNNSINRHMYHLILLGPLLYSIGSMIWSDFSTRAPQQKLPNILSLIFSIFVIIMPYQRINEKFFTFQTEDEQLYEQKQIFFSSDYDRLNPLTCQQANKKHLADVQQYERNHRQSIVHCRKNSKINNRMAAIHN